MDRSIDEWIDFVLVGTFVGIPTIFLGLKFAENPLATLSFCGGIMLFAVRGLVVLWEISIALGLIGFLWFVAREATKKAQT